MNPQNTLRETVWDIFPTDILVFEFTNYKLYLSMEKIIYLQITSPEL